MRRMLEMELGAPVEALFDHFDDVPLASASIGQVYAARLKDGAEVIVKVQRPGVDAVIEEDLAILAEIARVAEGRLAIAQQADATGLVREFSWTIRQELDYEREGRNAERLQEAFPDGSGIVVPRVVWEFTTRRVLTMERLHGVRIDRVGEITALGVDTKAVAETALLAYVRQVLTLGMFHADPHPGNFLVQADGCIGLLDFGLVGTLDERVREHLLLLALATFERDPARISEELAMLGAVPASWDRAAVERDIARLLTKYLDVPLGMIQVREVIYDVMSMIRRHGLRLPSELALLAKTVSQAEALGRRLDPDINLAQVAGPAVQEALGMFYSPAFWRQKLRMKPLEIALLGASLPSHIQRLLTRLDRNELTFHINYDELPETMKQMNSMVNRIALAVVCAAGAIGASIIFLAVQPVLFSLTGWLFVVLFALLGLMAANVLWRIWRSGR
jgi:ubiquinone biosynthesis protein